MNRYPDFNSKVLHASENELRNLFPICEFTRKNCKYIKISTLHQIYTDYSGGLTVKEEHI